MIAVDQLFPLDHPAAQGHFPGNPIIPGAVLLSETLQAIEKSLDLRLVPAQLRSAKFLHPVRPGETVRIEFSILSAGTIEFACSVGPTAVMTGAVACEGIFTPA